MEANASTSQQAGPQAPAAFPTAAKKRKTKWPFLLGGIVVIVLGIASAYLLVNRAGSRSQGEDQNSSETVEKIEYKNPNGFSVDYPNTLQLVQEEEGIRLTGDTEIVFMVKALEKPLEQTVDEVASNFGIDPETTAFSMQTVNSRTGFALLYEGKEYQYFPLYGEYYLEVVSDELNQMAKEVLSSLEFTAPQATLN